MELIETVANSKIGLIIGISVRSFLWGYRVLQIVMLGNFRVLVDGVRVHSDLGPAGKKLAGLLFAFPAKPHRRERLAEMFWPELDSERSRAALNSAVWRLRKLLAHEPASRGGQYLQTVGSDIVLEPGSWLEIDVLRFKKAIHESLIRTDSLDDLQTQNRLSHALGWYEAPFLDGEDSDWILEEREKLHSMFVRAAMSLVRHFGTAHDYENGIALCRRILNFEPYRESIVRCLLLLLSLNDQRSEAIRTYESWSNSLKREVGVRPMPATAQLMDELRNCQCEGQFETIRRRVFFPDKSQGLSATLA